MPLTDEEREAACMKCGAFGTLMRQPFGERYVCRECVRNTVRVVFPDTSHANRVVLGVEAAGLLRDVYEALMGKRDR